MKVKHTAGMELHGKIGDIVFYRLNGKLVARRAAQVPKEHFRKDKKYQFLRKQQSEFGMCSQLGKVIREGIGSDINWGDSTISGRLTGKLRSMLLDGNGEAGQRSFKPESFHRLKEFRFHAKRQLDQVLKQMPLVKVHPLTGQVEYLFEDFIATDSLRWPKNALAVILSYGVVALSMTVFKEKTYRLLHPDLHGKSVFQSAVFKRERIPEHFELKVNLGIKDPVPEGLVLLAFLGVEFDNSPGSRVGGVAGVGSREENCTSLR